MKSNKAKEKILIQKAQAELARFNRERRIKLIKALTSSSIIAVAFTIVFGLAIGGAFEGMLSLIGLSSIQNEATGIYADCSLTKNHELKYCQRYKKNAADAEWRKVGQSNRDSAKFKLSQY